MENVKWSGIVDKIGVEYNNLPETAKTLVRRLVLEDIKAKGIDKEIEKKMEEFVDFYKQKGYTADDIVKEVNISANVLLSGFSWESKVFYEVSGKVKTPHTYEHTGYMEGRITLVNISYTKDRNEVGQLIIDLTDMTKKIDELKRDNSRLRDRIASLEEELADQEEGDC